MAYSSNPTHSKTNAYRNLAIYLERPSPLEAFEFVTTAEETAAVFEEMEARLDGEELGLCLLHVAFRLEGEGKPEKALSFAEKALKALDHDGEPSLVVAMVLRLMGTINFSLKKFDESLGYLNRADRMNGREEGLASIEDITQNLYHVHLVFGCVKRAMGRGDEAIGHLKKALEIQEMTSEIDGSFELGIAYRDLSETCLSFSKLEEALPFGLKALEIHKEELGHNSELVAYDRKNLGDIYFGMEEHEKALEQYELSSKVFKRCGLSSASLCQEMNAANMQIVLGKYYEAISTLKGILKQTKNEKDSENQATMFFWIGVGLYKQNKFADTKGCFEIACSIFDKIEAVSPCFVANLCPEIALCYAGMDDTDTAISLLKRTLALIEKQPQEKHTDRLIYARTGWMHLLRGEVLEAIPCLENAVEKMKESSFASRHFVAGQVYNNLGAAYLELNRHQSAAQMFVIAKDILDASLGPNHPNSIGACQNLSKAYSAMESYTLAFEFQQQVHGTSSNQLPTKALLIPRDTHSKI